MTVFRPLRLAGHGTGDHPPDCRPQRDALLSLLAENFPRWMLPDDVVVVDELPHTATGKVMKTRLRELYATHKLSQA